MWTWQFTVLHLLTITHRPVKHLFTYNEHLAYAFLAVACARCSIQYG